MQSDSDSDSVLVPPALPRPSRVPNVRTPHSVPKFRTRARNSVRTPRVQDFALQGSQISHSKGPRFRTPRVQLSVQRVQHVTSFTRSNISRSQGLRFRSHEVCNFALRSSKILRSHCPRFRTPRVQDFALQGSKISHSRFRTPQISHSKDIG